MINLNSGSLPEIERALLAETERLAPYRVNVPLGRSGPWQVKKVSVTFDFQTLRLVRDGRGTGPGEYTHLVHDQHGTVMSDTNAEIKDFLPYIRGMSGDILVTGLGIGCVLQALLAKDSVRHVTVIEQSPDVIALVGDVYRGPRTTIINADAYEWKPPRGQKFDWGWHDVWNSPSTDDLKDMARMKRRYSRSMRASRRQFCWAEDWLR